MIGQTIDVLICSFIVALLPHGRDDPFTFAFTEHHCVSYRSFTFFFSTFSVAHFFLLLYL
jgi:hypothetical protein